MAVIPPVPYWQPALGLIGQVATDTDDIDQCIRVILGTNKGTMPMDPEFGISTDRYIDAPQGMANVQLVREVTAALLKYEPRAKVLGVSMSAVIGQTTIRVTWVPVDSAQTASTQTTTATISSGGSN